MKQSLNQMFQDDKTKTYEVIWRSILKRYQTVKLTTDDNADTFANIGANFDLGMIEYIVKNKFGFKSESKKSVEEQTPTQNADIEKIRATRIEKMKELARRMVY